MSTAISAGLRTGRWEFVSSLTSAGFAVRELGVKTVSGQFPVQAAWVDVDASGRPVAVHASLDVAGVDTGNARRDRDLRKPGLLDTAQYPTLTFDGGPAQRTSDTEWVVPGRLTGHGASVELTLHVETTSMRDDHIALRAITELDRRELGVTAPRVLIGRRIGVHIDATFAAPARR